MAIWYWKTFDVMHVCRVAKFRKFGGKASPTEKVYASFKIETTSKQWFSRFQITGQVRKHIVKGYLWKNLVLFFCKTKKAVPSFLHMFTRRGGLESSEMNSDSLISSSGFRQSCI